MWLGLEIQAGRVLKTWTFNNGLLVYGFKPVILSWLKLLPAISCSRIVEALASSTNREILMWSDQTKPHMFSVS